uniref:Uncharacterized protein n=1 Tax=Arundo donax TaxID=35708 RepID=A0A0A9BEC3_ARUDO
MMESDLFSCVDRFIPLLWRKSFVQFSVGPRVHIYCS